MSLGRKATAEFIGTFWLVLGGCGTAVLAGAHVGWLGVALAFGLTVVTMAYAIGHISGCHLNPAVSVGLAVGGRMPARELPAYIGAQVLGGLAAAAVLAFIASGAAGTTWEERKPAGPRMAASINQNSPVASFSLNSANVIPKRRSKLLKNRAVHSTMSRLAFSSIEIGVILLLIKNTSGMSKCS